MSISTVERGIWQMYDCKQSSTLMIFSFFFFQAEDGIRDIGVTGVQTCALPIFTAAPIASRLLVCPRRRKAIDCPISFIALRKIRSCGALRFFKTTSNRPFWRSEERRVGKEC